MTTLWRAQDVLGVDLPEHTVRTYLEQQDIRRILARVGHVEVAADVGAGFGRLTPVLREFADDVAAFEREAEMVEVGMRLLPWAAWYHIASLDRLPCANGLFDLVLTFTVLQHLTDESATAAAAEIRRIVQPGGHVLICEESDSKHRWGPVGEAGQIFTIGRSDEMYEALMAPLQLVEASPRRVEPTYSRANCGSYLLFRG